MGIAAIAFGYFLFGIGAIKIINWSFFRNEYGDGGAPIKSDYPVRQGLAVVLWPLVLLVMIGFTLLHMLGKLAD